MILRRFVVPLCLALTLAVTPAHARVAESGSSGIGDPYFPLDGNGGIDVLKYSIRAAYDFDTHVLRGTTVVRLRATQDLSSFNLDLLLGVSRVRIDGRAAAFSKPNRHELRISPATPIAAGQAVNVEVTYAGRPGRQSYVGESNWLSAGGEVAAINEPHMAPWWFPANDHPSDTARLDVQIRAPRGKQVLSNGRLIGVDRGPRTNRWHWRASEPMAPYLAFFTVGRFRIERADTAVGRSIMAVSRRLPLAEQERALRALRRSDEIAGRLAKRIGQPYPFDAIGGVVSGVLEGFALENQTRPTYPGFAPSRWLMAHELAHQWFGNKVTLERWSDIWLNEGFAEWFSAVESLGEADTLDGLRTEYAMAGAGSSFWDVPPGDPGRDRVFDHAVYLRGAMTLGALHRRIGHTAFHEVIRRWAAQTGPATTSDFIALAESVSGQDLSAFFDVWLFTPAKPANTAANGLG